MFDVNGYRIVFRRIWHENNRCRYDTLCEIFIPGLEVPRFTGIARLHPNDNPDRITGKKVALRDAMGTKCTCSDHYHYPLSFSFQKVDFHQKEKREAIWSAFWSWVESWPNKSCIREDKTCQGST